MRTKAERRKNDYKHIAKKEYILKHVYSNGAFDGVTRGGQIHRLDKGKVHCSCPMCADKEKYRGKRHSDKLKIESMNYKEKDFENI